MELVEFEAILEAKLNPIAEAIRKLEQQQEKMVEIMVAQSRMNEVLLHLQKSLDAHILNSTKTHDEVFTRLRELEEHKPCNSVRKELDERMDNLEEKSDTRLWDIIQLVIAAIVGAVIGREIGK